jgi:hypothetical protein
VRSPADPPIAASARLHSGVCSRLANRLLRAEAFVLGRRVFLSAAAAAEIARGTERGRRLLAHEMEHVRQYTEIGIPRFLRVYLADYLRARLAGAGHAAAYASIRFERAAFSAGGRCAIGAESFQDRGKHRTTPC